MFSSTMDLSKGCPLLPYLFILTSEILIRTLKNDQSMGRLTRAVINGTGELVTHLLFGNDFSIATQAILQETKELKDVL